MYSVDFLVRGAALQVQELGSVKADSGSALVPRQLQLDGPLGIGLKLDVLTVQADRRLIANGLQRPFEASGDPLDLVVMVADRLVGVRIHDPEPTIQDQDFPLFQERLRPPYAHYRRDAEAAGQNRRMAVRAAMFGDNSGDAPFMQNRQFPGREFG
jgi:hypothetical protein